MTGRCSFALFALIRGQTSSAFICENLRLIVGPPISKRRRHFFFPAIERALLATRLLLCDENAFLSTSNASMRMQTFQNELCRGDQDFGTRFVRKTERRQLIRQS